MATLKLAAHQTEIIGRGNAPPEGEFGEVLLGYQSRLLIDAVELSFGAITLERIGSRTVELINGACLRLGALAFASLGAGVLYRIGARCTLEFDANLSEPEAVSHTTIVFVHATARLRYLPFANPLWRGSPRIAGSPGPDMLEHMGGGRLEVDNGRLADAGDAADAAEAQG